MTVTIEPWRRRHSHQMEKWPRETDGQVAAFVLRAAHEPYHVKPSSLAILYTSVLVGRFTYRLYSDVCFVGLHLQPAARRRGIGLQAMCISLRYLLRLGVRSVWCSVAAPNIPAIRLYDALGFRVLPDADWRDLPEDFNLNYFDVWDRSLTRLCPKPALLYYMMELDMSGWGNGNLAVLFTADAGSSPVSRLQGRSAYTLGLNLDGKGVMLNTTTDVCD